VVHFEIPRLRDLARHALPTVVEVTLIPLVLVLAALWLSGVTAALVIGTLWSYGALARRILSGRRVPGLLALGLLTVTARVALTVLTGSVFVYFLQPTLGTTLVALAFLASLATRRPLCERLATDFVPIPDDVLAHHGVRRFFRQITLLWAVTQLANATITLWLLASQPLATFLVARTVTSWVLVGSAIAASTAWFRSSMRRHGVLAPPAPVTA
jgi:uncharacterized membrane protein